MPNVRQWIEHAECVASSERSAGYQVAVLVGPFTFSGTSRATVTSLTRQQPTLYGSAPFGVDAV